MKLFTTTLLASLLLMSCNINKPPTPVIKVFRENDFSKFKSCPPVILPKAIKIERNLKSELAKANGAKQMDQTIISYIQYLDNKINTHNKELEKTRFNYWESCITYETNRK